jgi:hypothetical protein
LSFHVRVVVVIVVIVVVVVVVRLYSAADLSRVLVEGVRSLT